jgi:RND family efflux transporter MFP subunit
VSDGSGNEKDMSESLLQSDKPSAPALHEKELPSTDVGQKKRKGALWLKLFALVGVVSLIGLAVLGIMARERTTENLQKQADQVNAARTVSVIKPGEAPAIISIDLPGQTQAYMQASVFAQTTGYLKKWNFEMGSQVKEGDVLAEIDTPQVDQQLNQAQATLKQAQAGLDLARVTDQRDQDLLQRKVIARQDFDNAESDFRAKEGTVNADEAVVMRLQALESFKVLKAPFDGIVTVRNTDIGAMVNAGSGNPLFIVARVKPLRIYINVPESMAHQVAVGDKADLKFNEFPDRTFPGKVVRTAGAIDPTSRTLLTEVEVPNENGQLFPGAYMQVRLSAGGSKQSLLLPANTLLFRPEGTMVGVVGADHKVKLKKVKIGKDLGTHLEIVQGLLPDDQVIVNPSSNLANGQTVKVRGSQNEKELAAATP